MEFNYNIEGGNFSRAGTASSEVKKILKQLNVNPAVLKRIVVALYEAEVNVVAHAYEGTMQVSIDPTVITVVISDRGPGIPDIDLAMQDIPPPPPKSGKWDSEPEWVSQICRKTVTN